MVEEKVQVYEAGADDYLTKPFDFRELLVRIKALIKRQPQKPEIQNCVMTHDRSVAKQIRALVERESIFIL